MRDGPRYLTTEPSEIVKINLPPQARHFEASGGRRYFSLHAAQRNCCMENLRKLPLMSLRKCFWMTNLATSSILTARTFLAISICPINFSSIEGNVLYAEHWTPLLKLSTWCVKPKPS